MYLCTGACWLAGFQIDLIKADVRRKREGFNSFSELGKTCEIEECVLC